MGDKFCSRSFQRSLAWVSKNAKQKKFQERCFWIETNSEAIVVNIIWMTRKKIWKRRKSNIVYVHVSWMVHKHVREMSVTMCLWRAWDELLLIYVETNLAAQEQNCLRELFLWLYMMLCVTSFFKKAKLSNKPIVALYFRLENVFWMHAHIRYSWPAI